MSYDTKLIKLFINYDYKSNGVYCQKFMIDIPFIGCFGSIYNPNRNTFEDQKHYYKENEHFQLKWITQQNYASSLKLRDDLVDNTIKNSIFFHKDFYHNFYSKFLISLNKFIIKLDFFNNKYYNKTDIVDMVQELRFIIKELRKQIEESRYAKEDKEFTKIMEETSPVNKTEIRNIIKLAKVINNTGLKLVKDNFYQFIENNNNSNYIIIDGINVNKNRVKFIDVYKTPPVSNANA